MYNSCILPFITTLYCLTLLSLDMIYIKTCCFLSLCVWKALILFAFSYFFVLHISALIKSLPHVFAAKPARFLFCVICLLEKRGWLFFCVVIGKLKPVCLPVEREVLRNQGCPIIIVLLFSFSFSFSFFLYQLITN